MIRRAHSRATRAFAVLALTAPAAAGFVLTSSQPALASSGSITGPGAEAVFSSGSSVDAKASVSLSNHTSVKLTVTGPGLGSGYNTSKSYDCTSTITHSCASTQSASLTVTVPISPSTANGAFSVTLSGAVSDSSRFYTNFAPTATPSNLAAAPVGRTEVDLSWSYSGTEPDKAGFDILESHAGSTRSVTVPASVCNGSTCGYALTYPQPAESTTETYSYTVTALRSSGGCGACGDTTRSSASSSATAQLVGPPPPPSPTPTPTSGGTTGGTTGGTSGGSTSGGSTSGGSTGGSSGGSTGGSSTGGATGGTSTTGGHGTSTGGTTGKPISIPSLPPIVQSRRAFALGFNHFSPSLGIPKLPPLPALQSPETAPSNDTYAPTLPYKATQTKKTTSVFSSPISAVTSLDTAQLARYLAVGLILLVVAAHVRFFLSREIED